MTKDEAKIAASHGERVTHYNFLQNEWFTFSEGQIVTEDGVRMDPDEFWKIRENNKSWDEGYSIKHVY